MKFVTLNTSTFDTNFGNVRDEFYKFITLSFKKMAGLFGYPENPGMPIAYRFRKDADPRAEFLDSLPFHDTWPPIERPENLFSALFGTRLELENVKRHVYESDIEGFYNFYILNYKNLIYLPDSVSRFIQIQLHVSYDIKGLEAIQGGLFFFLILYGSIVMARTNLFWYISVNPYKFPSNFLVAAVDWAEDFLQGFFPAILGVNITSSILLGIVGILADNLNHLVFTMPYLPSEGEETELLINGETKQVVLYHYLPKLWYECPIPNELREYWFNERNDILIFMLNAYYDLRIKFTPDRFQEIIIDDDATIKMLEQAYAKAEILSVYDFLISKDINININQFIQIHFIDLINHFLS
uniref:Hypothetical chloroplast RF89 n=1 Tax=Climaconeis cf. scalaris TaxID=2846828 RepID=A0A8F8X881_9STRA|nr:hypothetical chloroplast RF89 [Climaconeis cf. scalaris]QYB19335.1 hypothetical chloroplast RF89 [Climaconeis cf. scalaris]